MGIRAVGIMLSTVVGITLLVAPQASGAERAQAAPLTQTALQLQTDVKRVAPKGPVALTARLLDQSSGDPIADETLVLQYQRLGKSGWLDGDSATTAQGGRAEWQVRLQESTRFRMVHRLAGTVSASKSAVRKVFVKPIVTASLKRGWVRPSGIVRLKGRVRPGYVSEAVTLQRRVDGHWRSVRRTLTGERGRYVFSVAGKDAYGPQTYRVTLDARDHHLAATSRRQTLTTVRYITYNIETRGKVRGALKSFKRRAAEIYADPRGWSRSYIHFSRVNSGGAFSLVLSQAKYLPSFASICSTYFSCRSGRYVVINEDRWRAGTPYFKKSGGTLRQYRAMVVNHETGHWLGLGHASCGGAGRPAPVMQQQSKGLYGCKPNAWPLPWEIARVR